jgi:hypothetical protein
MIKLLFLFLVSFNLFASEWCPDKVSVAPILYKNKVQPLFFVAEDVLKDFKYSYKLRPSTVFCLISLKHKGIDQTTEIYPPLDIQNKLKNKFNKKLVSMEDLYVAKEKYDEDVTALLDKYIKIRNGEYWNVPIVFDKNIKWEKLHSLSINEQFPERLNKIKVQYIAAFGWDYLYEYYFYIFIRLFIITLLVVGFVFIQLKHSRNKKE